MATIKIKTIIKLQDGIVLLIIFDINSLYETHNIGSCRAAAAIIIIVTVVAVNYWYYYYSYECYYFCSCCYTLPTNMSNIALSMVRATVCSVKIYHVTVDFRYKQRIFYRCFFCFVLLVGPSLQCLEFVKSKRIFIRFAHSFAKEKLIKLEIFQLFCHCFDIRSS